MNISGIGIDCVGCGNCADSCGKSAIKMQQSCCGFEYPNVDNEICIGCGRCYSVCPQTGQLESHAEWHETFMAVTKSKKIWKKSASGGVFGTIAHDWLHHANRVACGASYTDGKVRHVIIAAMGDIPRIQGSKYVQSDVTGIFLEIKRLARERKKVLFSGTPCQCHALKKMLNEDEQKHVLIIDIICHGVPSMKHLLKDLGGYRIKGQISNLDFRLKQKHYFTNSAYALNIFQSKSIRKIIMSDRDPYFNLFMEGKNFRESCYQCRYANLNRIGDITIGDCDSHKLYPDFYPHTAVSTVIVNSEKGRVFWNQVKHLFDYRVLELNMEAKYNHQLVRPFEKPKDYEMVMKDFKTLPIEHLRRKYARPFDVRYYMLRILGLLLPDYVIHNLVMCVKKKDTR